MPKLVQQTIVRQLTELYNYQNQPFSVVLHGGEPLLLGARRLRELCAHLRSDLPSSCDIHIQTNGVLLTEEIIDLIVQHNVGISISYDGPEAVHDQFRVDLKGVGSHTKVSNAIDRLNNRADARSLFTGVLAVVDPSSDPHSVYYSLKATGSPKIDFLVRDGNYDELPYMKSTVSSTEYGCWLAKLLDIYLSDPEPPRIRVLDDMLRLILGASAQKEGIGTADYGILVIETDGQVNKNDTLKVAYRGADRFENNTWSILTDSLIDIVNTPAYEEYYRQQRPTAPVCLNCEEYNVCGGGMVAHRWSKKDGFNNPSVFCADQLFLIKHIRERIEQFGTMRSYVRRKQ